MGLTVIEALAIAQKYTDDSMDGAGAVKGAPCKIQSITPITGGNRVTYLWEDNEGVEHTSVMNVMDGPQGERGERGVIGPTGAQGIQGVQGPAGPKGDTGAQGIQGVQGIQGIQGIQGEKGDDGYPFLIYKQYDDISEFDEADFPEIGLMFMVMVEDYDSEDPPQSIGYPIYRYTGEGNPPYSLVVHLASQGIKGEKGDKGDTGAQGIQGEKGEQGEKGDKGDKGDTGAQGIQGEQGVGLPDGGTTGQVLVKYSDEDYDFDWKDTTDRVRPNSHALVEAGACYSAIIEAVSSIYEPRGSITVAELVPALLIQENVKNAYNVTDSGVTTEYFIQGAGVTINAGDTVGIISAGPSTILFNLMGNTLDLTDYQTKDLSQTIGSYTEVEGALSGHETRLARAEAVIPEGASVSNKLVAQDDKKLVEFFHNIPRKTPKDITSYVSDGSIWKRLNGTDGYELFEDMYVGDYFRMSRAITAPNQDSQYATTGSDYVTIAGIDTRMGDGDGGDSVSTVNYHHLVMVPGKGFEGTQHFGRKRMNSSNDTTGGYIASEMHTATIGAVVSSGSTASGATINQQLYAEFGVHLKTTRELLSNTLNATGYNRFGTNSGCASNWVWTSCQAVLMSEVECYGATVWSSSGYDTGNACDQLPLFRHNKQARNNRSSYYWLKDIASAAYFCHCDGNGRANYYYASYANYYVRPRFILA